MNRNQRLATVAALAVLLLTICFAPWQKYNQAGHMLAGKWEYGFILAKPNTTNSSGFDTPCRLAVAPILTAWAAIGLFYAGTFFLLRTRRWVKPD